MHAPNRTPETPSRQLVAALPMLASLLLLTFSGTAMGQAGSKESQKFLGYSEDARESISDGRDQLQIALSHYNALIKGEAGNSQSTYKGFAKAFGRTEKYAAKTRDHIKKMQSQAARVFKAWQKELDAYQNDALRQLSADRLEVTMQRYEKMIQRMAAAGKAYDPLIIALRDQDLFMSRDLSTEALATLSPMAVEVNQMAEKLYGRIAEVLDEQVNDEAQLTAEEAAAARK